MATATKNKPMGFWEACHDLRKNPLPGWTHEAIEKTDSNMVMRFQDIRILIENARTVMKYSKETKLTAEQKKQFRISMSVPGALAIHWVAPDDLRSFVMSLSMDGSAPQQEAAIPEIPPAIAAEPDPTEPPLIEQEPVPELVLEPTPAPEPEIVLKPIPEAEIPKINVRIFDATGMTVGAYVKIRNKEKYPKVMHGAVQRIDARKPGQAQITRWYARQNRRVAKWVPLEDLILVPEYEVPKDNCPAHAPNMPETAQDSFTRGWCKVCQLKADCAWWKREKEGK